MDAKAFIYDSLEKINLTGTGNVVEAYQTNTY